MNKRRNLVTQNLYRDNKEVNPSILEYAIVLVMVAIASIGALLGLSKFWEAISGRTESDSK